MSRTEPHTPMETQRHSPLRASMRCTLIMYHRQRHLQTLNMDRRQTQRQTRVVVVHVRHKKRGGQRYRWLAAKKIAFTIGRR